MASIRSIGYALLVAAILVAGCDEHAVESGGANEVVFDLRPLFQSSQGESCATVVDLLALTVTDADGDTRTVERALAPDDAEVRIPVEVAVGTVTFEAEVRSNNGTPLYAGSASAEVTDDGFEIEVRLDAVGAVLKACPGVVPLLLFDDRFEGELRVINRGSRAVAWEANYESPLCDNVPCFSLVPRTSNLAAGDTVRALGTLSPLSPQTTYDVQITSAVGTLDVQFTADFQRPVAAPDTVTVLEDGFATIDVLANDTDPEGDPLTLVSVGDALYGSTDLEGNAALYAANYEPVWGVTSEDRFSYFVDAGGRRDDGDVTVRVSPCFAFEQATKTGTADLPLLTENGVTATTRHFNFGNDEIGFGFVATQAVFDASDDLGAYLTDAAVELDWSAQPVRFVRFDFTGDAALVNVGLNGEAPEIAADLPAAGMNLDDVAVRVEDGKFGAGSRLVLEADATPISRLLLGGGDPNNELRTLIVDDICFGLAPPGD